MTSSTSMLRLSRSKRIILLSLVITVSSKGFWHTVTRDDADELAARQQAHRVREEAFSYQFSQLLTERFSIADTSPTPQCRDVTKLSRLNRACFRKGKSASSVDYASARSGTKKSRTTPIALSVLAMDFKPSFSMPVNARIASTVSGTTMA